MCVILGSVMFANGAVSWVFSQSGDKVVAYTTGSIELPDNLNLQPITPIAGAGDFAELGYHGGMLKGTSVMAEMPIVIMDLPFDGDVSADFVSGNSFLAVSSQFKSGLVFSMGDVTTVNGKSILTPVSYMEFHNTQVSDLFKSGFGSGDLIPIYELSNGERINVKIAVPEPNGALLLGVAGFSLLILRRRKN